MPLRVAGTDQIRLIFVGERGIAKRPVGAAGSARVVTETVADIGEMLPPVSTAWTA
jgi:hypothetical protein